MDLKNAKSIEIQVKTNQRKREIKQDKDKIIVSVKSKAENNEANKEIEQFLTKKTGKQAKIIKGKTTNKKTIKLN